MERDRAFVEARCASLGRRWRWRKGSKNESLVRQRAANLSGRPGSRLSLARCQTRVVRMIGLLEGGRRIRKKEPEKVLWLHASIVGCRPKIWRRLAVRETMWLSRLHDTLQIAFDWFDYQTHSFQLDERRFGNPLKREELTIEDDRDVTLMDLDISRRARFVYGYHFGEGWMIDIGVEKVLGVEKGHGYPRCLAGERAGQPEDCGGLEAYHDLVRSLKEPETDLGREWREWVGPDYDPELCSLEKIDKALKRLGR